jgi:hypothetical protein
VSAHCKVPGCIAAIIWAVTEAGARMPIDADSAGQADGTWAVWREDGKPFSALHCRPLTDGEQPDAARGEHRGTVHWATCTNANAARRRCPSCGHLAHKDPCKTLGKVECRRFEGGSLRGQFPCGCEISSEVPA